MKTKTLNSTIQLRVGDEALRNATDKNWNEWCGILDKAGAAKMSHREIADFLGARHQLPPWWRQMVTVGYEQARGRRIRHETKKGFQISVSKTLPAPVAEVSKFWTDVKKSRTWLRLNFAVRSETAGKYLRIDWPGGANLEVGFLAKGDNKCQMSVQHNKLKDAKAAAEMKRFWRERVEALAALFN
ncbi:MAG: hypothetical protein HY286_12690 [Planctomycetes bacterium]|nr:hypothetical protein [Planctomycetota bacterium]